MNNQSVSLLSILYRCNPQDETLSHESKLQSILHSSEYLEVSKREAFSQQFQELFAPDKLRSYSPKQLSNVTKVLPLIPTVLEDLVYSLQNGDAPSLTKGDAPDFMDKDSLERIIAKLHNSTGKNYCNIAPDDFMAIFDQDTIKDINEDYYDLPANCSDYGAAIATLYAGKKYCISGSEIQEKEQEYLEKVECLQDEIRTAKKKKRTRRFTKFAVGVIALLIPSLIGGVTGLLSSGAVSMGTLIVFLVTLLFWIRG